MILAVALSALGSTLASLASGVRVTFAMGADGVLPRLFGRTDARFKTPVLATVIIGVIASMGVCRDAATRWSVAAGVGEQGSRSRAVIAGQNTLEKGYLTLDDPADRPFLFRWG
jgi:amino acid transporter